MMIIGYTVDKNPPQSSPFVDKVIKLGQYSDLQCDYAIDITAGELTEDPRAWLTGGAAYYGDYYDHNGLYSLHSLFPHASQSIRTSYPGILYKESSLIKCTSKNPLEEICKNNIIYYIPRPIFRIKA